jgi:hypothetical protein
LMMSGLLIDKPCNRDEDIWNELKALAAETHQNVSGLLTEAMREYVTRKRVRPIPPNEKFRTSALIFATIAVESAQAEKAPGMRPTLLPKSI